MCIRDRIRRVSPISSCAMNLLAQLLMSGRRSAVENAFPNGVKEVSALVRTLLWNCKSTKLSHRDSLLRVDLSLRNLLVRGVRVVFRKNQRAIKILRY